MSRVVANYIYTDDYARPVLMKVRRDTEEANRKFEMKAARYVNNRLYWKGGKGVLDKWQPEWAPKSLYNLPVLLDAIKRGETTLVAEGERDCDTATALWKLSRAGFSGDSELTPRR